MPYTIEEHKHRFAAWAAGRAASVINCRFTVEQAKSILEEAGLYHILANPDLLPSPDETDEAHKRWRENTIEVASRYGLIFTHGVAAKLINIYFKAGLICGGDSDNARIQALHPPIDSVLLKALCDHDIGENGVFWKQAKKIRWSKFNSDQYQEVINHIRKSIPNQPLWKIEQYWQGYQ